MASLIGYARVSTKDQNLDLQLDALKKAGCHAIYTDKISGTKTRRERRGLSRALGKAKRGDTLVIWKLDRLGRTVSELVKILAWLEDRGVHMRELTKGMGFETSTATGKLLFHVMAAVAELERGMGVERTKAGLEAARLRGVVLGRPRALVQDKANAVRDLLSQGTSVREVAHTVGVHPSTIYRYRQYLLSSKQ